MYARVWPALAALLAFSAAAPAVAQSKAPSLLRHKAKVVAATVTLTERGCAGALVRSSREILTAAHCIPKDASLVEVRLPDGTEQSVRVAHRDEETDLALLELDVPASATPLPLADEIPKKGSSLLFVGRTDRKSRTQTVRVDRVDRCPWLPALPNVLFSSLQARPGDSGAPLVDAQGRVAAIVHGGARCEILVPTAAIASVSLEPATPRPTPAEPEREAKSDGWLFERTERGFRFRWSFRWRSN